MQGNREGGRYLKQAFKRYSSEKFVKPKLIVKVTQTEYITLYIIGLQKDNQFLVPIIGLNLI